ncbi:23S rRNA (pseudouridine(1915)-N(3))-methyltransferase RlmH [Thermotoga caldifontis]|uniref:23S rRNA (pseudouridine(1915)-N(3))-methyltransferase RlmH n=1 Tax=Thermotoga caldifontis TaxID=1508419 RepID=UPI0005973C67|nr:23S rRNA (pseudouridine(1915)-N(3))-methyltransferase RlmH [Thermotoga caldifontis]
MKIDVWVLGKMKNFAKIAEEYMKMLSRFVDIDLLELGHESIEDESLLRKDAMKVLKMLRDDDYLVLLDEHGTSYDSISFANHLSELLCKRNRIVYLVGGPMGVDESVKARANERLSLSRMTLTHRLAVVVLLEQLFRSFKILNNERYHY